MSRIKSEPDLQTERVHKLVLKFNKNKSTPRLISGDIFKLEE